MVSMRFPDNFLLISLMFVGHFLPIIKYKVPITVSFKVQLYTRKKHIRILVYFYVFSDAAFNGTIFKVVKIDLDLENVNFQFYY